MPSGAVGVELCRTPVLAPTGLEDSAIFLECLKIHL
jgi:hypothetical protein